MSQLMTIFVSGASGNSVVFGVLSGDQFTGADLFGSKLDGMLKKGKDSVTLNLSVDVPDGIIPVQGNILPQGGMHYDIHEELPLDYAERDFVVLRTPYGNVNARFQVLRSA